MYHCDPNANWDLMFLGQNSLIEWNAVSLCIISKAFEQLRHFY